MKTIKLLLFLFAILQHQTIGYDLRLVGKVKLPQKISDSDIINNQLIINQADDDGKVDVTMFPYDFSFIIDRSGSSVIPEIPKEIIEDESHSTNLIGTVVENGVLKAVQSETTISHSYTLDRSVIFKTFSTNGYSLIINDRIRLSSNVFKISATSKDQISWDEKIKNKFFIIDYNNQNQIVNKTSFNGQYMTQGHYHQYNPKSKYNIATDVKDGYLYVYYITSTSSPYFLTSTKLTINAIDAISVSGTIETQSTNTISIQSSENIVDWRTIKTIQNPSGKNFIIPATNPTEFIRAIE